MSGKRWSVLNTILSVIGGLCALFGIYTSFKASDYDQEQEFKALEERYGLTPIEEEAE